MEPIITELLVLQLIYTFLLNELKEERGAIKENDVEIEDDESLIIPHIKISLVKITNEVQNNVLINEILQSVSYTHLDVYKRQGMVW